MADIDKIFYSNGVLIEEIREVLSKKVEEIDDITKIMEDLREYSIEDAVKSIESDLEKRCGKMDDCLGLVYELVKKRRADNIPTLSKNTYWDEFLYLNITNKKFISELTKIIEKIYLNLMEVFSELRLAHCLLQNFKNKGMHTGNSIECVNKQIGETAKIVKLANGDLAILLTQIKDSFNKEAQHPKSN